MIEIFSDIPDDQKRMVQIVVDNAFSANKPWAQTVEEILDYRELCDPSLKDFIDFYVHVKIGEYKNESNNDQW